MNAIDKIIAQFQEDGSATVLARVTASDGTGAATGVPGEGNWVKVADLTSITRKIYDRSSSTPDTAIATATLTLADVIEDTPVTSNTLWTIDTTGFNFNDTLAATSFPDGSHKYVVEYLFVTTGSAKWALQVEGVAHPVIGS